MRLLKLTLTITLKTAAKYLNANQLNRLKLKVMYLHHKNKLCL